MDIEPNKYKANDLPQEKEDAAIADMAKQGKQKFKEDKDLKVGRALRSPVMNAVNALSPASQQYDKERYTDEVIGQRDDDENVLDLIRDTSYVGGTIAADVTAAKAISKLLGKLGLAPMSADKREARQALKSGDANKLKKALDKSTKVFMGPKAEGLSIQDREALAMKTLRKEMPASGDALVQLQRHVKPGTLGEVSKAKNIQEQIAGIEEGGAKLAEGMTDAGVIGGRAVSKALEENETYKDLKDLNPSRKHGFISTILDTLKTTQLINNRDMIDIDRVKREFPIEKLKAEQIKEFNDLVEKGYDKQLLNFVLSPEIRLQIKDGNNKEKEGNNNE